jgi:hypothetical protein
MKLNDNIVDTLIKNDYMDELLNKYSNELKYFKLVNTLNEFINLELKGTIRYINKYDKKLRNGGLVVKIIQKENNWYAMIKKPDGIFNYVSYNLNYIFYCYNIGEIYDREFKEQLSIFIKCIDDNI